MQEFCIFQELKIKENTHFKFIYVNEHVLQQEFSCPICVLNKNLKQRVRLENEHGSNNEKLNGDS